MFLKRVYISGFKSFAKPTQLTFDNDINAIVGPNGSGKSNISDAIRFVLGEQRTSQMRSQKMEDIIFSGTDSERARGAAEVRLVLDRGEQGDMEISRKLYRTGESVYLINGKKVRLKDIQKLFYDTGLGKNGYSIISQGGVDKIVTSNPASIRELVEEAVGIAGYKAKRNETERHLSATQDNIDRVEDILEEIEYQIKPLELRANKARRYLEINKILRSIDLVYFYYEQTSIEERIEALKKEIGQSDFRILDLQKRSAEIDERFVRARDISNEIRVEVDEIEKMLNTKRDDYSKRRESRVRLDTLLERERIELTAFTKDIKRLESEIDEHKISSKSFQEEIKKDTEVLERNLKEKDRLKIDIEKIDQKLETIRKRRKEDESKRESNEIKSREISDRLITLKTRLNQLKDKRDFLSKSYDELKKIKSEISAKKDELGTKKSELEKVEERIQKNILTQDDLLSKRQKTFTYREQQRAKETSLVERLEYQKSLRESHRGYSRAVREILDYSKSDKDVYGVVGELFSTDSRYALAISTVLGARAQNVIVEEEADASRLIDYLKKNQLGRVTFLPIKSMRVNSIPEKTIEEMRMFEGFIDVASRLVVTEKIFLPVYTSLLSRTVVLSDFGAASLFRKKFPRFTIVTLDGEIFYPGGAVVGGKTGKETKTAVFQNLEIEKSETELEKVRSNLSKSDEYYSRLEKNINAIENKLSLDSDLKNDLDRKLTKLTDEISYLEQGLKDLDYNPDSIKSVTSEIKSIENEITELESELNLITLSSSDSLDEDRLLKKISDLRDELTEKNLRINTLEQRIENKKERIFEIEKRIFDREENLRVTVEKKREKEKRIQEDERELEELIDNIVLLEKSINKAETELNEKKEKLNSTIHEQSDFEEQIKLLNREQLSEIETKNKYEREQENLINKKKVQEQRIQETYNMDLMQVKAELNYLEEHKPDLDETEIRKLRKELKELGAVYPEAIDEYQKLSVRYKSLKKQHDDLIKAEENILETIASLNDSMAKQFSERFIILNEKFSYIFNSLFEGGEARMEYVDPENVLESGIELSAQPPGKSLKSLNLLSGGEKAMTAIALLLSFIELNPAPFSILDEIDAALDDNNIIRFTKFLKQMDGNNQFIIITHRKHTLEACNQINGITMSKDGVSRLIKLKVSDYLLLDE